MLSQVFHSQWQNWFFFFNKSPTFLKREACSSFQWDVVAWPIWGFLLHSKALIASPCWNYAAQKMETEQQLKKKKWLNHHWLDACFGSENMFGTRHANLSKIIVVRQKLWNKCTNQESRDTTKLLIRKMGVLHSLFISPALKLTYYLASLLKLSLGMVSLISKTR